MQYIMAENEKKGNPGMSLIFLRAKTKKSLFFATLFYVWEITVVRLFSHLAVRAVAGDVVVPVPRPGVPPRVDGGGGGLVVRVVPV